MKSKKAKTARKQKNKKARKQGFLQGESGDRRMTTPLPCGNGGKFSCEPNMTKAGDANLWANVGVCES